MESNTAKALHEAIAAIYFADDSDYKSALWKIVELLGGDEAVKLLEEKPGVAYLKYEPKPQPKHDNPATKEDYETMHDYFDRGKKGDE